jgi:hypothetical protein
MPQLNRKGIQTTPFLLLLSAVTLVLIAAVVLPAYGRWQEAANLGKAKMEAAKIRSTAESVRTLGDIGSVQQIRIDLPDKYAIGFTNNSIILANANATIEEYRLSAQLRYWGSAQLTGPGKYVLSVVHWTRDDETNKGKEYLLGALDT